MRAADLLLHGLSLGVCVALGAGFWQLKQVSVPAPPPAPSAIAPAPEPGAGQAEALQALARDVEGLRLRLADLEKIGPAFAPATVAAPAPAGPSSPPSAESLLAALDDPKVQEKLRQLREEGERKERQHYAFDALFDGMSLDGAKRQALEKLMMKSQADINDSLGKLRTKEWTRDQSRNQIELARGVVDAQVRAVLTEAQFKTYLERVAGMRLGMDGWLTGSPGKRGGISGFMR